MRLYRYRDGDAAVAAVERDGRLVPIGDAAPEVADRAAPPGGRAAGEPFGDLDALVQAGLLPALAEAVASGGPAADGPRLGEAELLAPLTRPPKIWCAGLNYLAHAADLDAPPPSAPVGFMRPTASMIGPGDTVFLPRDSARVTGEGELVLVLGRSGRDWTEEEAYGAVAALTLAVDLTAEDILRENPRFLTRAKSFDTFLSLGPCLATPDELGGADALPEVVTHTLKNGASARSAPVSRMTFSPDYLLAFFSRDATWSAGDLLLTGTPGAVVVEDGDTVGAEIRGIGRLENPVRRNL